MQLLIVILIIGVVICSSNGELHKVIFAESMTTFDDITITDESSKKYITLKIPIAKCVKKCQKLYDYRKNRCILNCCMEQCGKHFRDAEFWQCVREFASKYIKNRVG
ncbi:hypothetical protein PIB30_055640 [Stylosanthes scabra]|uniref:Uncharacterized protein n=1 Tax=Stylosanthes scabra TaxID=79078 RepID=A0ABU6TIZ8_9FABA|nr:hypothetical protein [Stylosanthes scabra]